MADAPMETRAVQLSTADLINLFGDMLTGTADAKPDGPWDALFRQAFEVERHGPLPEPWLQGGLAGHYVGEFYSPLVPPKPNWAIALTRDIAWLNPQPLPPVDSPLRGLRRLSALLVADIVAAGDAGPAKLDRFVDDWCGNGIRKIPLPKDPRPTPDPTSLILGASLSRLASGIEDRTLAASVRKAGERILQHGIHGPG